jgi:glutamate synthase domain-containing protein 2
MKVFDKDGSIKLAALNALQMAEGGCKFGIATQDSKNLSQYTGKTDSVEDFVFLLANSTYKIVNQLGCSSLEELKGKAIDYVDINKDNIL